MWYFSCPATHKPGKWAVPQQDACHTYGHTNQRKKRGTMTSQNQKSVAYLLVGLWLAGAAACVPMEQQTTEASATLPTEPGTAIVLPSEESTILPVTAAPAEASPASNSLWQRLRNGFSLPQDQHPRIEPHLTWYQNNPRYLERVMERADPYLFHIVEQLEARNMPHEIALLPVVESAFDPFAYSHGRAAGLWQFIPSTGKRFGLKQNWWYDGRRDVFASTDAALEYLQYLHRLFDGDWMLALAAYNSGEGTVRRAVRKNRKAGKGEDFWSLKLPDETREYVPKLLALSRLVAQPNAYEQSLRPIPNEPRIAQVETGGQLDLAVAAKLAELPLEDLYQLNPGFNRWATDPKGPFQLVLPLDSVDTFNSALAELPPEERVQWVRHQVQAGDSLSKVAQQYRTTVAVLKDTNQLKNDRIRVGKYLLVPVATRNLDEYKLSAEQRLARIQNRNRGGVKKRHVVQAGDSLWKLAKQYQVSVRTLAKWNSMAPGDPLRQGTQLVIWDRSADRQTTRPIHYKVRTGDSLSQISSRFKVSVSDLCSWNGLSTEGLIKPGQTLKLFVDVTRQTES